MTNRAQPVHRSRMAATLLALGACMGISAAIGSLDSSTHRLRGAARHWVAAPPLAPDFSAAQITGAGACSAAALALLLLWGLHIRANAAPAENTSSPTASPAFVSRMHCVAWVRSLHRGGLYGP